MVSVCIELKNSHRYDDMNQWQPDTPYSGKGEKPRRSPGRKYDMSLKYRYFVVSSP